MDSKKSLGYSPLGMISHEESQFDFIADRKPLAEPKSVADEQVSHLIEERPSPVSTSKSKQEKTESDDIFSEFLNQKTDNSIFNIGQKENDEPSKKSASYYMSSEIIQKLRDHADKHDDTYSSVAEKAIKAYLDNL
ncbi:MAG: hypothetical protein WD381_01870 [Balneolaceae bacterium]